MTRSPLVLPLIFLLIPAVYAQKTERSSARAPAAPEATQELREVFPPLETESLESRLLYGNVPADVPAGQRYSSQQKERFQAQAEVRLNLLENDVDRVRARYETAVERKSRRQTRELIEILEDRRDIARLTLSDLKSAQPMEWPEVRARMEIVLQDLQAAFEKAKQAVR